MNYVFLGAGAYGFEAESRTYFGKSVKDLNLEEAALLAPCLSRPNIRRHVVWKRRESAATSFWTKWRNTSPRNTRRPKLTPPRQSDRARRHRVLPVAAKIDGVGLPGEEIRKYLEEKYTTRVAQGGLKVYTTVNVEAQKNRDQVDPRTPPRIRSPAFMAFGLRQYTHR